MEFKASWDEESTGLQVIRTLCAFANDFQNVNGGYIVIGVAEENGKALLPAKGLTAKELEEAEKWIRGRCNRIDPVYYPVFSPEIIDNKHVLVLWAPGSNQRPHSAPESNENKSTRKFYIRIASSTIDADSKPVLKTQLLQMTAQVPFDDRRALQAEVSDIRESKVREFLHEVRSELADELDTGRLYRHFRIVEAVNSHYVPKNIGLLFFSQDPGFWFPGARIEVVQFAATDKSGDVLAERIFAKQPIHEQLRACLAYLESLSGRLTKKLSNSFQASRWLDYPIPAVREALVNAVYHRSYEKEHILEPSKVYLFPDRMEIISHPGPLPGIEMHHLSGEISLPPVSARNRRIGELLKDLGLAEGRGTGIPKLRRVMRQNGSGPPRFDFDENRTYLRVTLPVHPEYQTVLVLQNIAYLRVVGDYHGALQELQEALAKSPSSLGLAMELVRTWIAQDDLYAAETLYEEFARANPNSTTSLIILMATAYLDRGKQEKARIWLDRLSQLPNTDEAFEAAIQEKRAGRYERAHRYFSLTGEQVMQDVKALHEFAQVKMRLAAKAWHDERSGGRTKNKPGFRQMSASRKLLDEAREMLQRIIQMDAPRARHAWAWHDLGQVLKWCKMNSHDIRNAFAKAVELMPEESRFLESLQRLDSGRAALVNASATVPNKDR
ncbi:RNA-binding domain-containing protein [Candidatus Magnetaquicoccus inordinatus]|uniref:RNA-binding domain-containing protein n=1 Tax=Candidatus Magnetaquicoccus inordinatus TaxID=2496818 RepID=UPI00187D4E58|nr:RNA-binding domain-containing protein [Candidatus Magnetaquicoccus inordinatus]